MFNHPPRPRLRPDGTALRDLAPGDLVALETLTRFVRVSPILDLAQHTITIGDDAAENQTKYSRNTGKKFRGGRAAPQIRPATEADRREHHRLRATSLARDVLRALDDAPDGDGPMEATRAAHALIDELRHWCHWWTPHDRPRDGLVPRPWDDPQQA